MWLYRHQQTDTQSYISTLTAKMFPIYDTFEIYTSTVLAQLIKHITTSLEVYYSRTISIDTEYHDIHVYILSPTSNQDQEHMRC